MVMKRILISIFCIVLMVSTVSETSTFSSTKIKLLYGQGFARGINGKGIDIGSENNLLMQPQILWLANKNIDIALEYQYWKNRLGIEGLNEKVPQILFRWTF